MSPDQPLPYALPPSPPQKRGKGKLLAAGVGVLTLLGTVGGGYFYFGDGSARDRYELATPGTLLGEYKRIPGSADGPTDASDRKDNEDIGIVDSHNAGSDYTAGSGFNPKKLFFHGVWGKISDPERTLDKMFSKLADEPAKNAGNSSMNIEGTARKVTPKGLDGGAVMKCQYFKLSNGQMELRMPYCLWVDHSTAGAVGTVDPSAVRGGSAPSLDAAAETAARVRQEVRVKTEK
ncbi:hypothetical protein I5Q34_02120 [Streptomyces sp. AV19]|uniref:hypothetical protein n=1 Tax=Streptomyces sp. AV19 TaxID=2793068 RepID=UPI0018FE1030|nr:hypothetical protein [Streptomyces sp. AV19]MBH1933096.1 hypothetical protein [Streptomyces sp. AV19]MDG4531809.1 hypothetical protein [Streptomyces sp. AV19]